MTELAVREETAVARPAPQLPVPPMDDVDSWTRIVGQVVKLANEIYDTPFVPDGLRGSAPAVSACILAGREMGLGPMTSLANIDVIRGKPTQKPLLMRAMIQSRGHSWEDVDVTDTRAVVRGRRQGESAWTEVTFTADQAKKAGLNLGNYPGDKLYARASSRLARRKFADVIMGIPYTPEDVEDGLDDDEIGTVAESPKAAIEAPKPRTAQRKQRAQSPPPAQAAAPSAAADSAPPSAGAGGDLPPLPGEDEPDPTTSGASSSAHAPGSGSQRPTGEPSPSSGGGSAAAPDDAFGGERHRRLVGAVQGHFKRLGFTEEEKPQRLQAAAILANINDVASLNDMLPDELSTVADTLSRLRNRDALTALLVAQDTAADGE